MEGIDLRYLRYLFRIVAVMARRMVRIGDADLRIGSIALLARELECHDAGDIGLKGENLQVEHELRVVGEHRGDAYRPAQDGRLVFRYGFLWTFDLTLNLTNTVEILIEARPIRDSHALLKLRDVPREGIQQACSIAQGRAARGRVPALAEQSLEHDAGMRFGRKRGGRRRP